MEVEGIKVLYNNTNPHVCLGLETCRCQKHPRHATVFRQFLRRSRVAVHWLVEAAELVGASRQDAHDILLGADVLIGHLRQ